jgi:hypothetical protein
MLRDRRSTPRPHAAVLAAVMAIPFLTGLGAAQGTDDGPLQVHVTLAGEDIAIQWARPGTDPAAWSDVVAWRVDNGTVQWTAPTRAKVIEPGIVMHMARVPRPPDNASVTYRIGSDEDGFSAWRTVSEAPGENGVWRFVLVGDMGAVRVQKEPAAGRVVPMLAEEQAVAVLHAGDLAYGNGNASIWDEWFEEIEPLASNAFYQAAAGNHEHEANRLEGAMEEDPHPYRMFVDRLEYPAPELHYSFDVGPVHVLVINSEDACQAPPSGAGDPWSRTPSCAPSGANGSLLSFVEQDLAGHGEAAWTVVLMHRPAYSAGPHGGLAVLRERFVPIFEEHGVDLVVAGHEHNYQRSFPLRDGAVVDDDPSSYEAGDGIIHLVTGGGGARLYDLDGPQPSWSAARAVEHHYVRLDVTPEGLRATALSIPDRAVLDSFTVGPAPEAAGPTGPGPTDPSRTVQAAGLALALLALAAAAASTKRIKDK